MDLRCFRIFIALLPGATPTEMEWYTPSRTPLSDTGLAAFAPPQEEGRLRASPLPITTPLCTGRGNCSHVAVVGAPGIAAGRRLQEERVPHSYDESSTSAQVDEDSMSPSDIDAGRSTHLQEERNVLSEVEPSMSAKLQENHPPLLDIESDSGVRALSEQEALPSTEIGQESFPPEPPLAMSGVTSSVPLVNMLSPSYTTACPGGENCTIRAIAFSSDGKWLATGSRDSLVRIYSLQKDSMFELAHTLADATDQVSAVAFTGDNYWLATGSDDSMVRMYRMQGGVPCLEQTLSDDGDLVNDIVISGDGLWLAASFGGYDSVVRIYALQSRAVPAHIVDQEGTDVPVLVYDIQEPIGFIKAVAFSGDGRWLAAGAENIVRLYEMSSGAFVTPPPEERDGMVFYKPIIIYCKSLVWKHELEDGRHPDDTFITVVAFSTDSSWLATGAGDSAVRLFALNGGTPVLKHIVMDDTRWSISALVFSGDGRWLATCAGQRFVRLYTLQGSGPCAVPVLVHTIGFALEVDWFDPRDWIWTVAFSSDGRWLATGSRDSRLNLYKLENITIPAFASKPHTLTLDVNFGVEEEIQEGEKHEAGEEKDDIEAAAEAGGFRRRVQDAAKNRTRKRFQRRPGISWRRQLFPYEHGDDQYSLERDDELYYLPSERDEAMRPSLSKDTASTAAKPCDDEQDVSASGQELGDGDSASSGEEAWKRKRTNAEEPVLSDPEEEAWLRKRMRRKEDKASDKDEDDVPPTPRTRANRPERVAGLLSEEEGPFTVPQILPDALKMSGGIALSEMNTASIDDDDSAEVAEAGADDVVFEHPAASIAPATRLMKKKSCARRQIPKAGNMRSARLGQGGGPDGQGELAGLAFRVSTSGTRALVLAAVSAILSAVLAESCGCSRIPCSHTVHSMRAGGRDIAASYHLLRVEA